ncbi:MAG: anti-sigma factor domain-containing protein [Candidatus Limnocylindrales bacterium]
MTCDDVRDLAPAFALGALEPEQERAIRDHLATCPQAHEEIAAFAEVVPVLAESVKEVEPPTTLRDRILAAAAADLPVEAPAPAPAAVQATVAAAAPTPEPASSGQPIDLAAARAERTARRPLLAWVAGLAAVVAIVALGAWNISLRSDLAASQAYQAHVDAVLTEAAQPGSTSVVLTTPDDPTRGGLAVVGKVGTMSLVVRGLAPTSGSSVYEAWVIAPKHAPTPIGSFTVGSDGTGYMNGGPIPSISGPMTIALTHEPAPGATTPTLPIVSSGSAG